MLRRRKSNTHTHTHTRIHIAKLTADSSCTVCEWIKSSECVSYANMWSFFKLLTLLRESRVCIVLHCIEWRKQRIRSKLVRVSLIRVRLNTSVSHAHCLLFVCACAYATTAAAFSRCHCACVWESLVQLKFCLACIVLALLKSFHKQFGQFQFIRQTSINNNTKNKINVFNAEKRFHRLIALFL